MNQPVEAILRLPDVERASGLKRSRIFEKIAAGTFPAPIKISDRASGWLQSEIRAWLNERIAERDAARAEAVA